mmetsp:Transcript_10223/g.23658  ORF Transcript_10223/g.23658 Transcript_10223/m.23658 type:complete len:201 (-) Transcript_10223:293-895(-)
MGLGMVGPIISLLRSTSCIRTARPRPVDTRRRMKAMAGFIVHRAAVEAGRSPPSPRIETDGPPVLHVEASVRWPTARTVSAEAHGRTLLKMRTRSRRRFGSLPSMRRRGSFARHLPPQSHSRPSLVPRASEAILVSEQRGRLPGAGMRQMQEELAERPQAPRVGRHRRSHSRSLRRAAVLLCSGSTCEVANYIIRPAFCS